MGGIVSGAFNVVKSVAKFGINMVKSVIKNPLPTIATIGLNFVAPGVANALGISNAFGIKGFGSTIIQGIGRAAISAATGGKLSSIVAAGITPFFNSPSFQNALGSLGGGYVGESLNKITNFVKTPLTQVFGSTMGNIFTGALGDSSVAGLVAAVSGQDIIEAMGSELVSSTVSQGIARSWNTLKTEVPKLLQAEVDIDQKALDAKIMKDTTPSISKVESLQYSINKNVADANASIDEYNVVYNKAMDAYGKAEASETQADYDRNIAEYITYEREANNIANKINQLYVPSINEEKALLEAEYNANKSVIDDYISRVDEVGQLSKSYELGVGKVLAENTDLKMTDAIARGDFVEASKFYNEFENLNKTLLELDPNAITVAPSIDLSAQTLLKDIYSTTDETLKNQLISQANLNQQFNDIRTNAPVSTPVTPTVPETPTPVEPTPTHPTVPETPAPVEPIPVTPVSPETPSTDERAPGYAELPKLPEEGIGQPTPSVPTTPTTPTTPSSGTGSNIINNIVSGAGNMLQNAAIGSVSNAITNAILGNEPPKKPVMPTKPRPASKVDVSTLTPFTGTLPSGIAQTGGLPTNTTQTPTQTPNSGLTSTTQPKTPPTKVDVSTLTPVTDMNWLKSLGIVQG